MTNTWTGIILLIAAFAISLRQIALSPRNVNWPAAPLPVRVSLFALMVVLYLRGLDLILGPSSRDVPVHLEGLLVAVVWAINEVILAVNVLRQNYPEKVWRKVTRVLRLAACPQREVVTALVEQGAEVRIPGVKDPAPVTKADLPDA